MTKAFNIENRGKQFIVLLIALAIVFGLVGILEYRALNKTNGTFMYPLDDTFIHMAIARNLAFFHTWGISKFHFASASSSLLYTLLLAGSFRVFSVHTVIPFVINALAGIALVIVILQWLKKQNVHPTGRSIIIILAIFFTPLPILIISGMEHTLQCLFSFLFVFKFSDWLGKTIDQEDRKEKLPWTIIFYGFLVTSTRFEGIFLIAIVGLILIIYKRIGSAILLGFVALLPVLLFGIFSISKGGYFFPNSVLLKSQGLELSLAGIKQYVLQILVDKLTLGKAIDAVATHQLLIILPLTYLISTRLFKLENSYRIIIIIVTACTFLHLCFASTGWFFRYEAYLILLTIVIVGVVVFKHRNEILKRGKQFSLFTVLILFTLLFPLVARSLSAFSQASRASVNVFEQQYQMSQFLKKYYNKDNIAANDVGAISFFTNGDNLDLWGIGDTEVAKSRVKKYYNSNFLYNQSLKKNIKVAVLYEAGFKLTLLDCWFKVATWKIPNNVICGEDTVSFYGTDRENANELKANLEQYQKSLPQDVEVVYY